MLSVGGRSSDETNAVIDFYLKHEVIQLLQAIDRDVGDREQLEARRIADEDAEAAVDDKRQVAAATNRSHNGASSLYSTTKFEVLASWLGQQRPHGESSEPQAPPAATTPNGSEARELRLEMVEAIPGVLHLNDVNALRYLHLLIDLLLTEEDHITVQTLIAKLQDLTYSALTGSRRFATSHPVVRVACVVCRVWSTRTVLMSLRRCRYSAEDAALLERTKVEVENKCFEMMQNRNAYMVLTAIRLVSLLEQSRKGEHRARDGIAVDHECQGDDDEKRTQRHARLRQVIHQTMALLSHREADARTEALDLLRVFVSGTHLPRLRSSFPRLRSFWCWLGWLTRLSRNECVCRHSPGPGRQSVSPLLDAQEPDLLRSRHRGRRSRRGCTALFPAARWYVHIRPHGRKPPLYWCAEYSPLTLSLPQGLDMLKRVEASVVNVVKTSAEDKAVVEVPTHHHQPPHPLSPVRERWRQRLTSH